MLQNADWVYGIIAVHTNTCKWEHAMCKSNLIIHRCRWTKNYKKYIDGNSAYIWCSFWYILVRIWLLNAANELKSRWANQNITCFKLHIDGLVQERRNLSAFAMELRLSCSKPSLYYDALIGFFISADWMQRNTSCHSNGIVHGPYILRKYVHNNRVLWNH